MATVLVVIGAGGVGVALGDRALEGVADGVVLAARGVALVVHAAAVADAMAIAVAARTNGFMCRRRRCRRIGCPAYASS